MLWSRRVVSNLFVLLCAAGAGAGCVTSGTYQAKVGELDQCQQRLAKVQGDLKTQGDSLAQIAKDADDCHGKLETCQTKAQALEGELGGLQTNLQATKQELDSIRHQHDLAEKRLAEYHKLAEKLRAMTDAGTISVKIRHGKMVVNLPAGVLFDSGSAQVKREGRGTLVQVAQALVQLTGRDFLIAGHTDNQGIHTPQFKSNWELSTARAAEVVKILQQAGVPPEHLAAAGFAEYDPVADNASKEGQAQNRRIEIVIMPNLEELPEMPEDLTSGGADAAGAAGAAAPSAAPAMTPAAASQPAGR